MKKALFAALSACVLLLGSQSASAAPSLEITDNGDEVIVFAHGIQVENPTTRAKGTYIEIDLDGVAARAAKTFARDKTVTSVETIGGPRPRLFIEMRKGNAAAQATAPLLRTQVVNGGLKLVVPRDPALAAAARDAAKAMQLPQATPEAAPTPASSASETTEKAPASAPVQAVANPGAIPLGKPSTPLVLRDPEPEGSFGMGTLSVSFLLLLLGGCAGLVYWNKKRQAVPSGISKIKILATQDLGGKTKLMLLAAGDKELLVSVSDQGARLLERWKAPSETQAQSPARSAARLAAVAEDAKAAALEPIPLPIRQPGQVKPVSAAQKPQSAAVAGLIKLRAQSTAQAPAPEPNEDDEDANWARELIALTKQQGGVS